MSFRNTLEKMVVACLIRTTEHFAECKVNPSHFEDFELRCMFEVFADYHKAGASFDPYTVGDDVYHFLGGMRKKGCRAHPDTIVAIMKDLLKFNAEPTRISALSEELLHQCIPPTSTGPTEKEIYNAQLRVIGSLALTCQNFGTIQCDETHFPNPALRAIFETFRDLCLAGSEFPINGNGSVQKFVDKVRERYDATANEITQVLIAATQAADDFRRLPEVSTELATLAGRRAG